MTGPQFVPVPVAQHRTHNNHKRRAADRHSTWATTLPRIHSQSHNTKLRFVAACTPRGEFCFAEFAPSSTGVAYNRNHE